MFVICDLRVGTPYTIFFPTNSIIFAIQKEKKQGQVDNNKECRLAASWDFYTMVTMVVVTK